MTPPLVFSVLSCALRTRLLQPVCFAGQNRLDVHDRCPVDDFQRLKSKASAVHLDNRHLVKSNRIRTVGRAGRKDPGQARAGIAAGVHALNLASRLMKPG